MPRWPALRRFIGVSWCVLLAMVGSCDFADDLADIPDDVGDVIDDPGDVIDDIDDIFDDPDPPLAPAGQWNKWFPIHPEMRFNPGANVSALWPNSEHLDLFATDSDGTVWSTWWEQGPGWQIWFPIRPESRFQPGATVTTLMPNSGHIDLFVTGGDGVVASTWWEQGPGWQAWFPIRAESTFHPGAPVTAVMPNNRHIDLFVTNAAGVVSSTWWELDAGWQPWFAIHPETTFQPGAVVTAAWADANHLDLFVTDRDGKVWSTWWEADAGWQAWFAIRPESAFQPGATVTARWADDDHLDLFITAADGGVWSTWWEQQAGWQAWFAIHPATKLEAGAPVTALWANGSHLDVFLTGSDGAVATTWWEDRSGWEPWSYVDPETRFDPGAAVTAVWSNASHLDLFVTAADGVVWSNFFDDTAAANWALLANDGFDGQSMKSTYFFAGNWRCCRGWNDWFPIQPEVRRFHPDATPTALWADPNHLDLFATDDVGVVWSTWMETGENPQGWQPWFAISPEYLFNGDGGAAIPQFQPGAPVTALWANEDHLDLFVTDEYGVVFSTWWEPDSVYAPWFAIRPGVAFQPGGKVTALWANQNHLDLFATDVEGFVWTTWWEPDVGYVDWFVQSFDFTFAPGAPVTALWANANHLDLFIADAEGRVWSTWWEPGVGYVDWYMIDPNAFFSPGATVTALWANPGHLDLFITDTQGRVWSTWWELGPGWQPWFAIGPEVTFKPGATVTAQWTTPGHLDLFVTDNNGFVRSTWWELESGWQPWFALRPEPTFRPGATVAATYSAAGQVDVFVTGSDGAIWSTFYPGYPRTKIYEYALGPNEHIYTIHPADSRDLGWSESPANRDFAVDKMIEAGVNVVTMSYWGKRGEDRWAAWAPMHTSTFAHDELFTAAKNKPILIMPAIESGDATLPCGGNAPAYHFASDFPGTNEEPAPLLVAQIEDLVDRYLLEPEDADWPSRWAQMYDRRGNKRYAINILHVASNQIGADEHERFARGFDRVAARVLESTGVLVGFTLDLLPDVHEVNMGGCSEDNKVIVRDTFVPSPKHTGPWLRQQASFLAVQAFIPEVRPTSEDEETLLEYKREYLESWIEQRLPVMLDVSPGYDGRLVFAGSKVWGNNDEWRNGQSELRSLPIRGIVFNTWNGYTEGYAAVPTLEFGDANFRWMQELLK